MLVTSLLSLLPLLTVSALASNQHDHARRNSAAHQKLSVREETAMLHARAAERIAESVEKRAPGALADKPRKVKRSGAGGCRVKGTTFTPSTTAASATYTPTADNQDYVAPASSTASSATPSATSNSDVSIGVGVSIGSGSSSSGSSGGGGNLTPGGKKAGASGTDTLDAFSPHISWYWDYTPDGDSSSPLTFMPTLWGNGGTGGQDEQRLQDFLSMSWNPQYVQGFYEPDCSPPMSSAIDPQTAAGQWNNWVVPWRAKGALLVSPGMCKQFNEDWLTPFLNAGATEWDITSIHINKIDVAGAQQDIDYYWNTYGKPIWVTEFACVDDSNGFTPSTDQGQINQYINDVVNLFESDSRVYAYSLSEGEGLGDVWPPWSNGQLTESGQTYLNAISKYN